MSREVSPATGKRYGVRRVCQALGIARSTVYAREQARLAGTPRPVPAKRGPKPKVSDETLLDAIRKDLELSPFTGEGHRKVWARLKFGQGVRVSRTRVLRLMREHNLLSPYRRPQGEPNTHEGTIGTAAPNVMWGTDATKVFTAEEGYGWVFVAVEHWNAECMGTHVCKKGDRMAALEPVAQGVLAQFGSVAFDSARGLALRMDHGSQYTSDHFQNQLRAGASLRAFRSFRNPKPTASPNVSFGPSKNNASTGAPSQPLKTCARPSRNSSNATTLNGASRKMVSARRTRCEHSGP